MFLADDLCTINRPNRSPVSNSLNSANKSIRPLLAGVPVSPTIRFNFGRSFIKALNRFDWWFLKDESSSITAISKLKAEAAPASVRFPRLAIVCFRG